MDVLTIFREDYQIYRARILSIDHRNCEVEFYDFGNVSTCSVDEIFYYDEGLFDFTPPLVSSHLNELEIEVNFRHIWHI